MIRQHFLPKVCPQWQDFPDIDLYMDQVISVLERYLAPFSDEEKSITSTMINNYVKQKMIAPPQNKRYSRPQLAILYVICILKKFMQLSDVHLLLNNLLSNRSEEEVYRLFSRELTSALNLLNDKKSYDFPALTDETENAVRAACVAYAAISYAREMYLTARDGWPREESDETTEKQEKQEKKEKKKKDKEKKK